MTMIFKHIPVLLDKCIDNLNIREDGIYVDCTVGGGGHSSEIAKRLSTGMLIAIDKDKEALEAARANISTKAPNCNVTYVHSNFCDTCDVLDEIGIDGIDGVLIDLGVSSYQFDEPERGFSYRNDGPLDMRMNREDSITAADIVNTYSCDKLTELFYKYGEASFSRAAANAICRRRETKKFERTVDLADVIASSAPAKIRRESHPAKQIFQALRIEVNDELGILERTVRSLSDKMNHGGRIGIITFHSLEDRIIKQTFAKLVKPCECPPQFPICVCGKISQFSAITGKPIIADKEELEYNSRSASAKLRVIERK